MSKPWVVIGLLVIGGMLLVPPKEVETYNTIGAAADDVINLEGVPDRDEPGEHRSTQVIYRPAWSEIGDELGHGERVEQTTLATNRLLLQVVVAVVVFGGLGLITGRSTEDETE
jgi:hypothetical protein